MNPLKLIRKFAKWVRGGAASWQILLSCLLGAVIGMTPSFDLTVVVAILLFVLLNVNLGLMLLGLAVGKALCLALAPVTFEVGYVLIHELGLAGAITVASATPGLALTNLHYYCMIGGLPIAVIAGCGLGYLAARAIRRVRRTVSEQADKSQKLQRLSRNILVRLLLWCLFGKQKKSMSEMLAARSPILRKSGVLACAVLVALFLVFELMFIDRLAKAGLVRGLEAAVGAEVNVREADVSLSGGRLKIVGLQITDPAKPTHNMVQADKLTCDLGVMDILTRRFVVEELAIGRLRLDAKRKAPGRVYEKPPEPEPRDMKLVVTEYFEKARELLPHLRKAKEYLGNRQEAKDRTERVPSREEMMELARKQGYLKLSADSVLARSPAVTIRKLRIEEIQVGDAGPYSIAGSELSSHPELNERPMTVSVTNKTNIDGMLTLSFAGSEPGHSLKFTAQDLSLPSLGLTDRVPIDAEAGQVDVRAGGPFNSETINVVAVLKLHHMKARTRKGRGFLGLDAATASKMIGRITTWEVVVVLAGPIDAPRAHVDVARTLAGLKKSLAEAGARELASLADGQLKKFADRIPVPLPAGLPDIKPAGILDGLGGGLGPKKDKGKDKPKTPATKPAGLLDGLFP